MCYMLEVKVELVDILPFSLIEGYLEWRTWISQFFLVLCLCWFRHRVVLELYMHQTRSILNTFCPVSSLCYCCQLYFFFNVIFVPLFIQGRLAEHVCFPPPATPWYTVRHSCWGVAQCNHSLNTEQVHSVWGA